MPDRTRIEHCASPGVAVRRRPSPNANGSRRHAGEDHRLAVAHIVGAYETPDLTALARDRDRHRAGVVERFRAVAIWWLTNPKPLAAARAEQDARYQSDAWDALIERWLAYERRRVNHGYGSYDDRRDKEVERPTLLSDISVGEILEQAIGIDPARWTRADQMRVSGYLKRMGWKRYRTTGSGPREWRYRQGR